MLKIVRGTIVRTSTGQTIFVRRENFKSFRRELARRGERITASRSGDFSEKQLEGKSPLPERPERFTPGSGPAPTAEEERRREALPRDPSDQFLFERRNGRLQLTEFGRQQQIERAAKREQMDFVIDRPQPTPTPTVPPSVPITPRPTPQRQTGFGLAMAAPVDTPKQPTPSFVVQQRGGFLVPTGAPQPLGPPRGLTTLGFGLTTPIQQTGEQIPLFFTPTPPPAPPTPRERAETFLRTTFTAEEGEPIRLFTEPFGIIKTVVRETRIPEREPALTPSGQGVIKAEGPAFTIRERIRRIPQTGFVGFLESEGLFDRRFGITEKGEEQFAASALAGPLFPVIRFLQQRTTTEVERQVQERARQRLSERFAIQSVTPEVREEITAEEFRAARRGVPIEQRFTGSEIAAFGGTGVAQTFGRKAITRAASFTEGLIPLFTRQRVASTTIEEPLLLEGGKPVGEGIQATKFRSLIARFPKRAKAETDITEQFVAAGEAGTVKKPLDIAILKKEVVAPPTKGLKLVEGEGGRIDVVPTLIKEAPPKPPKVERVKVKDFFRFTTTRGEIQRIAPSELGAPTPTGEVFGVRAATLGIKIPKGRSRQLTLGIVGKQSGPRLVDRRLFFSFEPEVRQTAKVAQKALDVGPGREPIRGFQETTFFESRGAQRDIAQQFTDKGTTKVLRRGITETGSRVEFREFVPETTIDTTPRGLDLAIKTLGERTGRVPFTAPKGFEKAASLISEQRVPVPRELPSLPATQARGSPLTGFSVLRDVSAVPTTRPAQPIVEEEVAAPLAFKPLRFVQQQPRSDAPPRLIQTPKALQEQERITGQIGVSLTQQVSPQEQRGLLAQQQVPELIFRQPQLTKQFQEEIQRQAQEERVIVPPPDTFLTPRGRGRGRPTPFVPPLPILPKLFERPKQVRPGRGFQRLGFTPSVVGLEIFTQTGEALTRAPEFVPGFGIRLPVRPRRKKKKKRGKK